MSNLTLFDVDDLLRAALRVRAAKHGRSPEDEACAILREALRPETCTNNNDVAGWEEFFCSVPPVPEDFMAERASQEQPAREIF